MTVTAIVLAAGEGKRFGGAKQLAKIGGKPLLEHVLDNLRASTIRDIVVVLGANAEAIRRAVSLDDVSVVVNRNYMRGMSTSIQAGLRAVTTDAALIVLGDQPYVVPETFSAIVAEYARTRAKLIVPTHNAARGNPVLIDRSLFADMMQLHGDVGGRAIFSKHSPHLFAGEDSGILRDIDEPGAVLE